MGLITRENAASINVAERLKRPAQHSGGDVLVQVSIAQSTRLARTGRDDIERSRHDPPREEFTIAPDDAGSIIYYASNFARYRLLYRGRERLIDTEQGRVAWQGACDHRGPEEPARSPTLDELEADAVRRREVASEANRF